MPTDPRHLAMRISLAVSGVMLVGKLTAYFLTGSAALLSDALESLVHGVATGFAAFSLWYGDQPADRLHPYGHGKIAYLSAGFEGALVLAAGTAIICAGAEGFVHGRVPQNLGIGMTIAGALAAINLVLGLALIRIGRQRQTLVLVANGRHVLSDMWTTLAALIGVGLVLITGYVWLDALTAALIGIYVLRSGAHLIRDAYRGLMDQVDPALVQRVEEALRQEVATGRLTDFHQVRCREVDSELFIDVHLLLPGDWSLSASHAEATAIENRLRQVAPERSVRVTSHLEPLDHTRAHPDGHVETPAAGNY